MNQSEKGVPPKTTAKEIGRAPSTAYSYVIAINQYYIVLNFYQHYDKAINQYYVILSVYEHYVIVIHRYYVILSIFAKITLHQYGIKTDKT